MALNLKVIVALLATLAIYYQDLIIIGNEALRSEVMGHILVIPFLFSYLLYRKRKMLKAVIPFETSRVKTFFTHELFGVTLCILGFLLYWYGSYTFHPLEYHVASLPLFVAGCVLLMFNSQTLKVLAFPIAFLLFLVPPPIEIVFLAGAVLSTFSSQAAYTILKSIGLSVNLTSEYGTPAIILENPEGLLLTFAVDIACAGIYSLIGFTIFAAFAAYISRGDLWKKVTMFLLGFPLIYALNITRIILIVLLGYQYGVEMAMQVFHLLGGWVLIFLGTFLLLFLSERICGIKIFAKNSKLACPRCSQNPEKEKTFCADCGRLLKNVEIKITIRDLFKIAALFISSILILLLAVPVFALTEGPVEVIIQSPGSVQGSTQIFPEISGYELQFVFRDERFEEIAEQDASLIYAYAPDHESSKIWVALEISETASSLHRWEICLIKYPQRYGRQPLVTQLDLRDVELLQNPPLIGRYFAFQDFESNVIQVVLYWYEEAIFKTGSGPQKEYVKLSVIAYGNNPEDVPRIEEQLLPFGEAIANYWKPLKTWSLIALEIARNGRSFISATVVLLGVIKGFQIMKNRKEKRSNITAYNKLAQGERLILQAAHQARIEDKPTINAIASAYKKLTQKPIEPSLLLEKLRKAEEVGLVKREILSHNDEPKLVWKNQVPL